MKNEKLQGKTVVITGASGGLGEQMAYLCAQNGANLFLLARNQVKLNQIAASIRDKYQVECTAMVLDVSKHDEIPCVFRNIFEQAGQIDVLVNNAGYGIFAEAEKVEFVDVEGMFAVNVVGLIACTQEVIPFMCKRGSGHIINVASQAGKLATPKSSIYSQQNMPCSAIRTACAWKWRSVASLSRLLIQGQSAPSSFKLPTPADLIYKI